MICPIAVQMILRRLYTNGYTAYVVGGAVRDSLLDKTPRDYDITTDATPEELKALFTDFKVINADQATTVFILGQPVEITTYRSDQKYNNTTALDRDLSRRDFTINALACGDDNNIIDLFGGEDDLKNHIIRCIGNPDECFKEDPLRMLRAIRFASQLDFTIEAKTEQAIFDNYALLTSVSKEKIREELNKFIIGYHVQYLFSRFQIVFNTLIPELTQLMFVQTSHIQLHSQLVEHTLSVVRNIPKETSYKLKIAALLHDIGKHGVEEFNEVNKVDDLECISFGGHEEKSEKIARKVLTDLRYSNEDTNYICELIRFHDYSLEATKKSIRKLLSKLVYIRDLNDLLTLMIANEKDHIEDLNEKKFETIRAKYVEILKSREAFSLKDLAITGEDLVSLGYQEKDTGLILDYILDLIIENPELNTRETLLEKCKTGALE